MRDINKADLEFYYGAVVLNLARQLSRKTPDEFSDLSYRSRKHWLDKAVTMASNLVNDPLVRYQLKRIY